MVCVENGLRLQAPALRDKKKCDDNSPYLYKVGTIPVVIYAARVETRACTLPTQPRDHSQGPNRWGACLRSCR